MGRHYELANVRSSWDESLRSIVLVNCEGIKSTIARITIGNSLCLPHPTLCTRSTSFRNGIRSTRSIALTFRFPSTCGKYCASRMFEVWRLSEASPATQSHHHIRYIGFQRLSLCIDFLSLITHDSLLLVAWKSVASLVMSQTEFLLLLASYWMISFMVTGWGVRTSNQVTR